MKMWRLFLVRLAAHAANVNFFHFFYADFTNFGHI